MPLVSGSAILLSVGAAVVGLATLMQHVRSRPAEITHAASRPAPQADPKLEAPQWDDDDEVEDTRTGRRRRWGELRLELGE